MMIENAKELLKSSNMDDRKLGILILSKLVEKEELKNIIQSLPCKPCKALAIFHTSDWNFRIYISYTHFSLGTYYKCTESIVDRENPGIEKILIYD